MLPCKIRMFLALFILIISFSNALDEENVPRRNNPDGVFEEFRTEDLNLGFSTESSGLDLATEKPIIFSKTKEPFRHSTKEHIPIPLSTEPPQTDSPQTDPPQTDPPQTNSPQTNSPQTDRPRTDPPQTDPPQTDSPQTDPPQTDPPQTHRPRTDPPQTDPPQTDPPRTVPPKTSSPRTRPQTTEAPRTRPPIIEIPNGTTIPEQSILKPTIPIPQAKLPTFLAASEKADENVENFEAEMEKRGEIGAFANFTSPTGLHQSLMTGTRNQERVSLNALAIEDVSKFMIKEIENINIVRMVETPFGSERCLPYPDCDVNSPYRTFDGSCNNPINFLVGMASTPVIRILPSEYQDGLSAPRGFSDIDGMPLPCARDVSHAVNPDIDRTETVQTLMTMQWGQFIDHDIILSPTSKVFSYGGAICCNPIVFTGTVDGVPQFFENQLPAFFFHPECYPICISEQDTFFSQFKKTCMDFVRTQPAPNIHCTMGPREQMNALSHYIDGSMIYGSDDNRAQMLRDPAGGGRLLVQDTNLLPKEVTRECPIDCFKAGDIRVNEQVGLTFTHTMWVREHNRLAKHFFDLNPDNEEAYQKARRLVIAEIQHITYNEFLPVVIGQDYMEHNEISTTPLGEHYEDYNELLDPSISNVFGAAAYRFGHTMIQNLIKLYNITNHVEETLQFRSQVFNPGRLYDDMFFSGIARGLTGQGSQICDAFFVDDVSNRLFQKQFEFFGLDLPALNIQRGRDHGLPPYVRFREEFCNLPKLNDFEDLGLPEEMLDRVKSVYKHVGDIDVFIGMLLEQPVHDAIVGATFQCIIGNQFFRSKQGDRYFYDNIDQPNPFTTEQLDGIKTGVTLSRVMCDNVEDFVSVQPLAFYKENPVWNPMMSCSDIPELDLSLFT